MNPKPFWLCCIFLVTAVGCQPVTVNQKGIIPSPSPTPIRQSTESLTLYDTQIPQAEMQTPDFIEPTPRNPVVVNETGSLWEGDQMPNFLEITRTSIIGENSGQIPVIGVGPTIYFYSPDSKVLMLHQTLTLESATGLLIGLNTILQTPGEVYEKREIFQFPSAQPALIQIVAFDAGTGFLKLVYAGNTFDLTPGESRSFKQVGGNSTVITIFSNHGSLADIQPISSDGSMR